MMSDDEVELVDELWAECCRHGEVERILILGGCGGGDEEEVSAAVRFQGIAAATACVDALDGELPCVHDACINHES